MGHEGSGIKEKEKLRGNADAALSGIQLGLCPEVSAPACGCTGKRKPKPEQQLCRGTLEKAIPGQIVTLNKRNHMPKGRLPLGQWLEDVLKEEWRQGWGEESFTLSETQGMLTSWMW